MPARKLSIFLFLIACADPIASDREQAATDQPPGKADAPGWEIAPTLHVGDEMFDRVTTGSRRVHAVWADASPEQPISFEVKVQSADGEPIRAAVLGPLRKGQREVIAAAGYSTETPVASMSFELTESGQHLVVVGTYQLASEAGYHIRARCDTCAPEQVDALALPKPGALVGAPAGDEVLVAMQLGSALIGTGSDIEVEVWAAPPMRSWDAELIAVSVASGNQVNVLLPASVLAGDDLLLVVRDPAGTVLDSGVTVRVAPEPAPMARLDAILYGDLVSVDIAGVTGYFEGTAELSLRSEDRNLTIADLSLAAERPGQQTNGLASFNATFAPEIFLPDGDINPALPHNGELLSVGWIDGNAGYHRLGCFEYCNDLSGMETCTGGERSCP